MRWEIILPVFASLFTFASAGDNGVQCQCDSPPCDGRFLNKDSLCECQYNAALFCWHRNGKACPSPIPQGCGKVLAPSITAQQTKPTFVAPYEGNDGLNCVEIGYCSRPTKSKTTMTVTNENGTQIITVAAGAAAAVGAVESPTPAADPYLSVDYPSPPSYPQQGGLITAVPDRK